MIYRFTVQIVTRPRRLPRISVRREPPDPLRISALPDFPPTKGR